MNARIEKLRKASFEAEPCISIERAVLETEFYRENYGKYSTPVLRALTFKHLCDNKTIYIGPDELVVGERGPFPKAVSTFPELTCHTVEDLRTLNDRPMTRYEISEEGINAYREKVIPYWQGRSMRERVFSHTPAKWKKAYTAGLFTEFMEQRAPGHTTLDGTIYQKGMHDFKREIAESLAALDYMNDPEASEKAEQLKAMDIACDAAIVFAERHAALAGQMAAEETDSRRKAELIRIAANCRRMLAHVPQDFWEAVQMYWFVHLGTITELNGWDAMSPGHLDQHLDPGFDGCWMGCTVACAHGVRDFVPCTGPYQGEKVFVDGPEYETIAGCGSNIGVFDPFTILEINFYCDAYGLDTISVGTSIAFVMECFELGLINRSHTGGLALDFGNRSAALTLLHQMARGEGFGKIVGQGIRKMKAIFADEYGADAAMMQDIGMEAKGLEFAEYVSKESLAQQGGFGLALKGPQHDEAWLIFLDMVHNFMPTFEQKAEALHWFPMFRTWFGLCGLCKLPWNDIVPEDNKDTEDPAKVEKHVKWYAQYFNAVTGRNAAPADLITMSEAVYNFQRIFNLKMGFGRREQDQIPYRAMGPVTVEEYESRQERYDEQLVKKYGLDIAGKSSADKVALLRRFRREQYEKLQDAVYKRRGWTPDGIPTLETVKRLGIDFPEIVKLLSAHGIE